MPSPRTYTTAGAFRRGLEERLKREIPLRRFGHLPECGHAAVMLLSDELSGYTTGAELVVDGGLSLRSLNFNSEEELARMNLAKG